VTRRRTLPILLAAFVALVLLEVAINVAVHPQQGPAALATVVEPHLLAAGAMAGLVAILLSLGSGTAGAGIRLAGAAIIVVAIVRLGGEWWSPAPAVGGAAADASGSADGSVPAAMRVLSWNLELGSKAAADSVAGIADSDADLVALQELTPDVAAAIEADPVLGKRYPYRILEARGGVAGLGLLSRRPLIVRGYATGPLILRAGLLLPDGRTIEVLDVHPYPPQMTTLWRVPVGLDTRRRDEDLLAIRGVAGSLTDPGAALVIGDINTTPFEPGYRALSEQSTYGTLVDAHEAVGTGPGFTWRPSSLEGLKLGLLRIDHVFTGMWLRPVAVSEDCSLPGDHCRLLVTVEAVAGT
jgi:endonuclease/exonuclease/phosphatase (EEP) superfamily protein YafD